MATVGQPADYDMLHRSFVRSLRAENAAPRTIEAYTLAVERLGEYLAVIDAELDVTDDLRREHVEGFLNALSDQGLTPATINQRYRSLMRFFGYLLEEGEIGTHPMAHIRPPKVPEQPVPVLTEDQVRALLATTKGRGFLEVRDAAILRLLIDTGLRRAELTGLMSTISTWTTMSPSCSARVDASVRCRSARRRRWRSTVTSGPAAATPTPIVPSCG